MKIFLIAIIAGIVMVILLSLIKKDSKLAKLGINIKRTYCPTCNEKQPIVRKPLNQRQIMFGGYTCKNCGSEMDKYGTKIESK
ncbi:MAG: transposase-like protein [Flavobacteriaceae bacterium]|jgi:transposase-like protein|uniref:hypothetical protein n=1 Tax=Candidatus Marifrigoribacter sp. Uisw_064 TaxID=3230970 RepID=UPI003AD8968D